ncbi:putative superfamily III holin-X [Leucobacter komagatae]|uniref:Putative superfamily III holin-X n=1 Tax=Leucobacter komagatae TaxID=55969 RepID=A0A542Y712_9MICO|nr:phage holin family protein [Leucobacter komagatae]TQL43888.1 putative superfamily III holin-X [Leucobacter komagatae]
MSRKRDEAGTFELLARLPQQIVSLAKIEYNNAKLEAIGAAKKAGIGAAGVVVALFFVFFMLQALVIAAIAALALVWPWWLAALTVAAVLLLLAAGALFAGYKLIKRGNPVPEQTLDRVGADAAALSDVRINADAQPGHQPPTGPRPTSPTGSSGSTGSQGSAPYGYGGTR